MIDHTFHRRDAVYQLPLRPAPAAAVDAHALMLVKKKMTR